MPCWIIGVDLDDRVCVARTILGQDHDLGLVVDLGGARSVARPLGHNLHGLPAQILTRGYHLGALPSFRSRGKAITDWLVHALLGDDFVRIGLRDTQDGTLGAIDAEISYLTAEEARTVAGSLPATLT